MVASRERFASWGVPGVVPPQRFQDPPRILVICARYWMGSNDVVAVMLRALRTIVPDVLEYNLGDHPEAVEALHDSAWPLVPKVVRYEAIRPYMDALRPHIVLCIAGGITFGERDFLEVNRRAITVGLALSDPETFPHHGRAFAQRFRYYFTNSHTALMEYRRRGTHARIFQHGCDPGFHRPMDVPKQYDVVVVGHGKRDRVETVNALARHCTVGVWGSGWDACSVRPAEEVHGEDYLKAICSGRLYLSFPRTHSGHLAVKYGVFEATACRMPVLTERFDELSAYFRYGAEIIGYGDVSELFHTVEYYLDHQDAAQAIAEAGYQRCLRDHTWHQRWIELLRTVGCTE
jgi:spore maturation protein CgeB